MEERDKGYYPEPTPWDSGGDRSGPRKPLPDPDGWAKPYGYWPNGGGKNFELDPGI